MKVRGFITHKSAECFADCADYFKINPETGRIAVADGVSQSVMPQEWASILVKAYTDEGWELSDEIGPLQKKWDEEAKNFIQSEKDRGSDPWMLENSIKERQGAGATLCGIAFGEKGFWKASILGDSCLVKIDDKGNVTEIIASREGAFDNRPDYFDSYLQKRGSVKYIDGILKDSEKILLVSDPFSELLQNIKEMTNNHPVVEKLLSVNSFDEYEKIVEYLRIEFNMHNDDSTLVIIEPDNCDHINIIHQKTLEELVKEEAESARLSKEQEEAKDESRGKVRTGKELDSPYKNKNKFNSDGKCEYAQTAQSSEKQTSCTSSPEEEPTPNESPEETDDSVLCKVLYGHREASTKPPVDKADNPVEKIETSILTTEVRVSEKAVGEETAQESHADGKERDETFKSAGESGLPNFKTGKCPKRIQGGITHKGHHTGNDDEKCGKHSNKVEPNENGIAKFTIPEGVNPFVGIDPSEFERLGKTASLLFKQYHSKFEPLFARQKWNKDRTYKIDECFSDFWQELKSIIYRTNNNG